LTAFKEDSRHKVLVLLTDGEDNDPGALEAAQNAAKAGLKIFTIGIGTAAGDLLRVTDANGNSDYVRDEQGNVVKSHLNEALLQQIAGAAGGFYLPLRGANAIDTLYERGLAPLPKSEGRERLVRRYHEQYHWPLALAMLLLLAEMFLPERKMSKIRSPQSKVEATTLATLITILLLPIAANASPSSALREYKSGNYTNALQEFERLAQVNTNDLRLVFNAGAAAYRATNFDTALNDFQAATLSPDLKLQQQAYYNLGNTQFQLAKTAKDLDGIQSGLETAEKTFEHAVTLDKNDADAAFNLEFTKKTIERIKEFRAIILRAKDEADAAVREAEFQQAFEIMEKLPRNAKLLSPEQIKDFTKKLKDIDDIATPHQP
jgi:Ca-activated chloride channel family protein